MIKKTRIIVTIAITLVLTVIGVLIALNFTGGEKNVERKLPRLSQTQDPQFHRAMGSLLGPGIVGGNRALELLNGDQIFPAMLAAIRSAERSITFETYIYWAGDIGREFAAALAERARAGVKVHVLLDWVGSAKISDALLEEMQAAGVDVRKFHEPAWSSLARMNNRTHRKILVVDSLLVSVGSTNFDNRSFRLNDEANLNIFDAAFAARQTKIFEDDLSRSKRVTFEAWSNRPWQEKLKERVALLFESQL